MKQLSAGLDLSDPATSVSMTINGPAPMLMAMFMNTAIDQAVEKHLKETGQWDAAQKKRAEILGKKQPEYVGELPGTNDGLGLGTRGGTGDGQVGAEIRRETER